MQLPHQTTSNTSTTTFGVDQTSNWFAHSSHTQITPPSSPFPDDEKTIHQSPTPFQRLYKQLPQHANYTQTRIDNAEDHHLSSIANDTQSNPAFAFGHHPVNGTSQSVLGQLSPGPYNITTSASSFNKAPSFISYEPSASSSCRQPQPDSARNSPSVSTVLPTTLPTSEPAIATWKSYQVKTPSRLQFSYTPSSPSNSFTHSSIQDDLQSIGNESFASPNTSSNQRDHALNSHDASLDSQVLSPGPAASPDHSPPTTPPQTRRRSDYQVKFIDSPISDAQTAKPGEIRILTNNQSQSLFSNLNSGKSVSQLHDQSYTFMTPANQSWGLEFSSPAPVGLSNWLVKPQAGDEAHLNSPSAPIEDPIGALDQPGDPPPIVAHQSCQQHPPSTRPQVSDERVLTHERAFIQIQGAQRSSHESVVTTRSVTETLNPQLGQRATGNISESISNSLAPLPVFSPFSVPDPRHHHHHADDGGPESPLAMRRQKKVLFDPPELSYTPVLAPGVAKLHQFATTTSASTSALIDHSDANLNAPAPAAKLFTRPPAPVPHIPTTPDCSSGFIEIQIPKTAALNRLPLSGPQSSTLDGQAKPSGDRPFQSDPRTGSTPVLDQHSHRFFNTPSDVSGKSVYYSPELSMVIASSVNKNSVPAECEVEPTVTVRFRNSKEEMPPVASRCETPEEEGPQAHLDQPLKLSSSAATSQSPGSIITGYEVDHRKSSQSMLISVIESLRQELSIKNEMVRLLLLDKQESERSRAAVIGAMDDLKQKVKAVAANERAQTSKLEASVGKLGAEMAGRRWVEGEQARVLVRTLEPVLESYREANVQLEGRQGAMGDELERCRARIVELEAAAVAGAVLGDNDESLAKELERVGKELACREEEIVGIKKRHSELEIKYNTQLGHNAQVELVHENRLRSLESRMMTEAQLKQLNETDRLRIERHSLHSELVSRKACEAELRLENGSLHDQLDSLETELVQLRNSCEGLEKQVTELRAVEHSLRLEKKDMEAKLVRQEANEADFTQLRGSYKHLESEMQVLRAAMKESSNRDSEVVKQLEDKVAKLTSESADREMKVASLKKKRASLKADIEGLNIALEAKQQEIGILKRERQVWLIGETPVVVPKKMRIPLSHITNHQAEDNKEVGKRTSCV